MLSNPQVDIKRHGNPDNLKIENIKKVTKVTKKLLEILKKEVDKGEKNNKWQFKIRLAEFTDK
jgi:hypothetical protein